VVLARQTSSAPCLDCRYGLARPRHAWQGARGDLRPLLASSLQMFSLSSHVRGTVTCLPSPRGLSPGCLKIRPRCREAGGRRRDLHTCVLFTLVSELRNQPHSLLRANQARLPNPTVESRGLLTQRPSAIRRLALDRGHYLHPRLRFSLEVCATLHLHLLCLQPPSSLFLRYATCTSPIETKPPMSTALVFLGADI
jgi:hypothetical protein